MNKRLTRKQEKAVFAKGRRAPQPPRVSLPKAAKSAKKPALQADTDDWVHAGLRLAGLDAVVEGLDRWLEEVRAKPGRNSLVAEIEPLHKTAQQLTKDFEDLVQRLWDASEEHRRQRR